jgi:pimeloyl-ACP methyl ester carboxylesterase
LGPVAIARSEYVSNVIAGVKATHALTTYFDGAVGRPSRVMVWGCSLGGGVATLLREKYPNVYDGAIACASPGSDPKVNDASLAFAYDVTFGWPSEKWGPLEDIRDDLVSARDVMPVLMTQLPTTPDRYAKWEFIRRVMKIPLQVRLSAL